ncbi:Cell division protein FtsL [Arthrobacter sp. Bi83]|uniref:FtsB family cell division protein n=1 Tax=Arthrobacter sp. Bi83 TaxID=2822353 RepID=UPI001D24DF5D|nr:septum formation initiator family protein [Arthrobacter sp. Bi83]CAH0149491.1 Cell division protein FtsL [Arthrobacter sp. Bi83]
MATRRPKVPRVTPASRHPETGSPGGDVIQADFGGHRPADAVRETGTRESGAAGARESAASKANGTHGQPAKGTAPAGGPAPAKGSAPGKEAAGKNRGTSGSSAVQAADEALDPVPAKAFSGRMLALAVVMIAITIMLAPTVKIFIDKRAEIAALEADIAASKSNQDNLKRQVSRWQDPNYVKQQARDRINMVMPGETGYWVFGSDLPAGASGSQPGAAAAQDPANLPWVDSLWESIRRSATD